MVIHFLGGIACRTRCEDGHKDLTVYFVVVYVNAGAVQTRAACLTHAVDIDRLAAEGMRFTNVA